MKLVDPVNRLLHTSGLKNFADTGISSRASVWNCFTNVTMVSADVITEQRVDAIHNFDLGRDIDTIDKWVKI